MVLGLRSKTRKDTSIQVDYIVNVQEIKPWPPSQSLKSVQYVLLQWVNGDQNSGFIPAIVSNSAIVFNEPFMLPLTLSKEKKTRDNFQKNCLEFYLYESRKDKPAKGQLLGTAIINLADYGIIRDNVEISALVNCKKGSKSSAPPVLCVNVQPFDKDSSSQSPNDSLSVDKDVGEFAELLNMENGNESDISFLSEDDVSSHSSHTVSSSAFEADSSLAQNKEVANIKGKAHEQEQPQEPAKDKAEETLVTKFGSSGAYVNNNATFDHVILEDSLSNGNDSKQKVVEDGNTTTTDQVNNELSEYEKGEGSKERQRNLRSETLMPNRRAATNSKLKHMMSVQLPSGSDVYSEEIKNVVKAKEINNNLAQTRKNAKTNDSDEGTKLSIGSSDKLPNSGVSEKINNRAQTRNNAKTNETNEKRPSSVPSQNKQSVASSERKSEEKSKVEMLEEELREAAIVEAALYSIVAEHGSSTNKVHAPARRLSRFYIHAYKEKSCAKCANAARAAVSGLILVSKSSGNDVPRLTFWLSNLIILRAIINQAVQKTPLSKKSNLKAIGVVTSTAGRTSRDNLSSSKKGTNSSTQESCDWENPNTFLIALEKVEAWIFHKIVESVWWQTMTPHMQSAAAKASSKSSSSRKNKNALGDQEQGNFSIDLWKRAFRDACERLCPIRAGGHECGCLSVLARLVMEQLVDRLDVAMFNAILRESGDEMPTDPVSGPISDPKVLPIPAGKSSFGAGAQLKNAIGNWSRWLSDIFGIEDNDSADDEYGGDDNNGIENGKSFKAFRLLYALSNLMMLPMEMLADSVTRKEVCPIFGTEVIKAVLYNFVPDEFSPEPIPPAVLESLDTEDEDGNSKELITFPCTASPTIYTAPLADSLAGFIGEVGNQGLQRCASSMLRKSYTSDDELDELDSPINSIINDKNRISSASPTKSVWLPKGGRNIVRYQLLREVWRDGQ